MHFCSRRISFSLFLTLCSSSFTLKSPSVVPNCLPPWPNSPSYPSFLLSWTELSHNLTVSLPVLHESFDILSVSPGVFVQEIHQLIVLVLDIPQFLNHFLLSLAPHLGVSLQLLAFAVFVRPHLEQSVLQTLDALLGHDQIHMQLVILLDNPRDLMFEGGREGIALEWGCCWLSWCFSIEEGE